MILYFIAIYLLATFILTWMGIDSKSEGVRIFLISLIFTPLAGIFFVMKERHKATPFHGIVQTRIIKTSQKFSIKKFSIKFIFILSMFNNNIIFFKSFFYLK